MNEKFFYKLSNFIFDLVFIPNSKYAFKQHFYTQHQVEVGKKKFYYFTIEKLLQPFYNPEVIKRANHNENENEK